MKAYFSPAMTFGFDFRISFASFCNSIYRLLRRTFQRSEKAPQLIPGLLPGLFYVFHFLSIR